MKFSVEAYDLINAPGYFYVGTPFSLYERGLQAAWKEACLITGKLALKGISVYCPIAESYQIAIECSIDPRDPDFWKEFCKPKLDAAYGLIVVRMQGWEQSIGLTHEINEARKAGKPIVYLDP